MSAAAFFDVYRFMERWHQVPHLSKEGLYDNHFDGVAVRRSPLYSGVHPDKGNVANNKFHKMPQKLSDFKSELENSSKDDITEGVIKTNTAMLVQKMLNQIPFQYLHKHRV